MPRTWTNDSGLKLNASNLNDLEKELAVAGTIAAWQPATAYIAGQKVVSPEGDTVSAYAAHTSGATYNPDQWYGDFGYLVANFGGNDVAFEKLSIHHSADGKFVVPGINNPVHSPATGVRDPAVMKYQGVWYAAYTMNNGIDKTLGITSSSDLVNWATPTAVSVAAATSMWRAWAPEWAVDTDGTVRLYFTNVFQDATVLETWYITATNAALTTWTAPVKVAWTANPGNVIDPSFIYEDGSWTIFYGVGGYIHRATAATLTGTWTQQNSGDWASWRANSPDANTNLEGQQLVKIGPSSYRIYMDRYVGTGPTYEFKGYCYSEATSLTGPWSAPKACTTAPGYPSGQVLRHGAWIKLQSSADRSRVRAATVEGIPPIRTAAATGSATGVTGGQVWAGTFSLSGASKRAGDIVSVPGGGSFRQLKILVDGVYSVDFVAASSISFNGGWIAIKGPLQTPNYASQDIVVGAAAWSISLSNIFFAAGTVLEFYFSPAATQTSEQLTVNARVTKVM